ncbi:MAG: indole-3-glycerol phosphate synthase TrpC [Alphaproteobacteria bacterium]
MSENVLDKICAQTLRDLEARKKQKPLEQVKESLTDAPPVQGFLNAIKTKVNTDQTALICEIKKASPSKGLIRENFKPGELAKAYEQGGAACLSVLTDAPFFQGHMDYLIEAREACSLPVLRKDFMLDPYQIYEARGIGADCILLIVAALDDPELASLYDLSKTLGMDVLVEVHDEKELHRAMNLKPDLLGINNRNLKTLDVNVQTSHDLGHLAQDCGSVLVSESGIYTKEDIKSLKSSGFHTFLIGESLMRQDNVEKATNSLLG